MNEKEKIIASAIKFQFKNSQEFHIMTGKRHCDVFQLMYDNGIDYEKTTHIQGFMTSYDRFVDRYEAFDIALIAHQIAVNFEDERKKQLYSEDLW